MADPAVLTTPMPRRAMAALPPFAAGRRTQSEAITSLASHESLYAPLLSVPDVVAHSAARLDRYPDGGAAVLRERVAAYLGVMADEVATGPGSIGVLQQIIVSLCDTGHEVACAWRSFGAYSILVTLAGARPVPVPLGPDNEHDLEAMSAATTDRTRIVLLCTPSHPTGVPITSAAIERFLVTVPPHVLVVIDEAHLKTAIPFGVSDLAQQAAAAPLDAESDMRDRFTLIISERDRVSSRARALGRAVPDSQADFTGIRAAADRRERIVEAFAAADILVCGYTGDGVRITRAASVANDRVIRLLAELNSAGDEQ